MQTRRMEKAGFGVGVIGLGGEYLSGLSAQQTREIFDLALAVVIAANDRRILKPLLGRVLNMVQLSPLNADLAQIKYVEWFADAAQLEAQVEPIMVTVL